MHGEIPHWLETLASVALILAVVCFIVIIVDLLAGHRQHMWIMNVVWPITALWAGPLALFSYFKIGRLSTHQAMQAARNRGEDTPARKKPFGVAVALGATHCGAGCSLGDLIAEWIVVVAPLSLLGHKVFGTWALDFGLAFLLGIAFQYFTIKPMKHLSPGKGLIAAVKADSLSLTAWQLGMYGWMALGGLHLVWRNPQNRSSFLVHDADRNACRLHHVLPGQLVVAQEGNQGAHVTPQRESQ